MTSEKSFTIDSHSTCVLSKLNKYVVWVIEIVNMIVSSLFFHGTKCWKMRIIKLPKLKNTRSKHKVNTL